MKKFFSLSAIKESIKLRDKNNSDQLFERASINGKRFSNLSTNSLSSRQSFLNIEVIREGYNVDLTRVDSTFTKLHRACLLNYNEKKILKYIKKQPTTINQIDNVAHCSPMHLCVANNNIHYLSILIDNGGDVNLADGQGKTLLIKAIECTNEKITQYLIARRADVNKPDNKYKNTPLHWACLTAYFKAISILLNCTHINVNQVNANEETILHLIAKSNKNLYVFINDCLDNNGIDLDKQDTKGRTPLFIACLNGNYRCVEMLLKNNANPNINNLIGESPLQIAKSKGFVDIVDLLKNNSTDKYLKTVKLNDTNQANKIDQYLTSTTNQVKINIQDNDSWPETLSNASPIEKKQLVNENHLLNEDLDPTSFNSFKANIEIDSSSLTLSNDQNNEANKIPISHIAINTTKDQTPNITRKTILHPENDEFIKQMKCLIDEEIQMNEELDEMLFIKKTNSNHSKKDQVKFDHVNNHQMTTIYLSESDENSADENDGLIKKPNILVPDYELQKQNFKESNNLKKQNVIYGLSDGEDEQKIENIKGREILSDESTYYNQTGNAQISPQINKQAIKSNHESLEIFNQKNVDQLTNHIQVIRNSSLSSDENSKEEELINKFDTLMMKINEIERKNQALTGELDDALNREKELKNLNVELNCQFEEQNQQLIMLENRLKQSEKNYELIKMESEKFKDDFKIEREKFERDFVKLMQEEHKQTELHLMKLLDDKQELCNRLTNELNYLKDHYVNQEQTSFSNDNSNKNLNDNHLLKDLMRQNDKINENFEQIQKFLNKHLAITELVEKLNQVLQSLEEKFKEQFIQVDKEINDRKNELGKFIETNVVQYMENFFKMQMETKLTQLKIVIDELKQELIDFIYNYKLPKHNEQEITNLINQILIKSVKQSIVLNNPINNDEEPEKSPINDLIQKNSSNKNDYSNDSTVKDEDKTSLEFNADELFADEKQISDQEIKIKKIKKDKIKFNKLHGITKSKEHKKNRLINQYSDAILRSINNNDLKFANQLKVQNINDKKNNLKNGFKVKKQNTMLDQSHFQNQFNYLYENFNSQFNHYKIIPISKSMNEDKFYINANKIDSQFSKFDSANFHKQRQIVEQEIANLKVQLGLFPINRCERSSTWNL